MPGQMSSAQEKRDDPRFVEAIASNWLQRPRLTVDIVGLKAPRKGIMLHPRVAIGADCQN